MELGTPASRLASQSVERSRAMNLMDLNEQADLDFGRARRRAWLRRLVARFRREPAPGGMLPSFDDLRRSLRAHNRVSRGRRVVDLEQIVGSVGRPWDFDGAFMPLRASAAVAACPFARGQRRRGSAWTWRSTGAWIFRR